MLDRDLLNPQYFCFPQIVDDTSGVNSIFIKTLKQVLKFIHIEEHNAFIKPRPLAFINTKKLLQALNEQNHQRPICVMSTLSQDEAIAYSYQELGLNLFDLPWFSPLEQKVFRYVNLLELFNHIEDLRDCFSSTAAIDNEKFTAAAKHLQWARCHQFAREIQQAVGHGERDRMQDPDTTLESMQRSLRTVKNKYSDLPCETRCQLSRNIQRILDLPQEVNEQERLTRSQQIAALDCQNYRLAQTIHTPKSLESPKFKKIIILDDKEKFKELLEEEFQNLAKDTKNKLISDRVEVESLNEQLCWENFGLFKIEEGKKYDVVKRYKDELSPAEILEDV
jgi:hypothetical protein